MNILFPSHQNKIIGFFIVIAGFAGLIGSGLAEANSIDANPNPVFLDCKNGETEGSTTISWADLGQPQGSEVLLEINESSLIEWNSADSGSETYAPVSVGSSYRFILAEGTLPNITFLDSEIVTAKCKGKKKKTKKPLIKMYRGMKVTPHGTYVDFRFHSRESLSPRIKISAKAPLKITTVSPTDNPEFEHGSDIKLGLSKKGTKHFPRIKNLEPHRTYHYVIAAYDKTSKQWWKTTGTFTTLARFVQARFINIKVHDDSDELSDGEITFGFYINKKLHFRVGKHVGSDETIPITKNAGAILNRRDTVELGVIGYDDDMMESFVGPPAGPSNHELQELIERKATAGEGTDNEWSVATGEITIKPSELDQHSKIESDQESFTRPFTIKAFPGPKNDSDLKFTVKGTLKVRYQ